MTAKNHELLQLNRDNVRLTEQVAHQERDLHQARGDVRQRDQELAAAKGLPEELRATKAEWVSVVKENEALRAELASASKELAAEREARTVLGAAAAADAARLKAFEEVIDALKKNGVSTGSASSKQKQASLL